LQEIENILITKLGINDEAIIRLFVQPITYCQTAPIRTHQTAA
jgi:hypothetical protein